VYAYIDLYNVCVNTWNFYFCGNLNFELIMCCIKDIGFWIFSTFYRGWIHRGWTTVLVSLIQPQLNDLFPLVVVLYIFKIQSMLLLIFFEFHLDNVSIFLSLTKLDLITINY